MAVLLDGYAAWACVFLIVVLSLVPGANRPHTRLSGLMEHFIAYAGTGLILQFTNLPFHQLLLWWTALSCASCGLEVLQSFVPGRNPSYRDAMASIAGLTFGLIFGAVLTTEIKGGVP